MKILIIETEIQRIDILFENLKNMGYVVVIPNFEIIACFSVEIKRQK